MTTKPTAAQTDLLTTLLAIEANNLESDQRYAEAHNAKTVDALAAKGLVRFRLELTESGRAAAYEAVHPPNEEAPA